MNELQQEHWNDSAKAKNKYRTFVEKLFKRNTVASEDEQRNEGERVNKLVDTNQFWNAEESPQDAADRIISTSTEFSPDERQIAVTAFISETAPAVAMQLETGHLESAVRFFTETTESQLFGEDLAALHKDFFEIYIPNKLRSLVASSDRASLETVLTDIMGWSDMRYPEVQPYIETYLVTMRPYFENEESEKLADVDRYIEFYRKNYPTF